MSVKLKLAVVLFTLLGLVGLGVPAASAATGASSSAASAAETYKTKSGCAAHKKKYKKLKKKYQKTNASKYKKKYKKQLKKFKSCKNSGGGSAAKQQEAAVRAQLAGYTYTGTRGDGASVIVTLCSDGKWKSQTSRGGPWGISTGAQWHVRGLTYSSATHWVTQVGENKDETQGGWGIGMARDGSTFKVGIARFGGAENFGSVTQSSGAPICATL